MIRPLKEIGEGINEIYYCPLMKAKIFLKALPKPFDFS